MVEDPQMLARLERVKAGSRWAESLVGLPFAAGGRGRDGCDCWGLVRLAYRLVGIDLPSHDMVAPADRLAVAAAMIAAAGYPPWRTRVAIGGERALDLVAMRRPYDRTSPFGHVGVIVEPGWLLHIERETGSVIVRLSHWSVARRITAAYRHDAIAEKWPMENRP